MQNLGCNTEPCSCTEFRNIARAYLSTEFRYIQACAQINLDFTNTCIPTLILIQTVYVHRIIQIQYEVIKNKF
uniref:Uncharacterized protein n=1 Tax=Oryza brachyantha TaxID=4533 RepID=J3MVT6_ORYBR